MKNERPPQAERSCPELEMDREWSKIDSPSHETRLRDLIPTTFRNACRQSQKAKSLNPLARPILYPADGVIHWVDAVFHPVDAVFYPVDAVFYPVNGVFYLIDEVFYSIDPVF
jgi:hypothetical protein